MKRFITLIMLGFSASPALMAQYAVSTSSPLAPVTIRLRSALPQATVKIDGLKAVLIGAPIDGDDGSWTTSEIKNLQMTARTLRDNGVTVYEYYTPKNQWADIREKCRGAQFLMYRGHGVYDGSEPPKWVGGFALKKDFVSSEMLRQDLNLAPGAIVMIYGCFTAGNSGSDIGNIDLREAKRRVAMYSEPFIEKGFAGYYANWFGDAFQNYVAQLFAGKTLGDAYKAYDDFNEQTVDYATLPNTTADMWIDHDNWDGKIAYNNAFVGESSKTLMDLFGGGQIEVQKPVKTTTNLEGQSQGKFVSMSYLTELEKQVFYELNSVRRNPRAYAQHVKALLQYFDGDLMKYPGEIAIQTNEGRSAVEECYNVLMNTSPIDSIRPSRGLSLAAKDHVEDQGRTRKTGHDGSDGSSPFDRMERYGNWLNTAGENIDYGNNDARRIVLSLLVDDGVASRGHRENILNSAYKAVGIACGPHKEYRYMCVMDLAGGFKAKSSGKKTRGDGEEDE